MENYLIVGGTSGIGAKAASLISEKGHRLFLLSRSKPKGGLNREVTHVGYDATSGNDLDMDQFPDSIDGLASIRELSDS